MTLPNFLYIGPPKSGSTWLFENLAAHPEVYITPSKDTYFFDRYYGRGLDWYVSHFSGAKGGEKIIGEICHDYLFSAKASHRIACHLPNAKLLVILRNPYERLLSHVQFCVRNGRSFQSLSDAIEQEKVHVIDHNLYSKYLSNFEEYLSRGLLRIMLYDDLSIQSADFFSQVCEFLGLTVVDVPGLERKANSSAAPRSRTLSAIVYFLARHVREMGFGKLVGTIKKSFVRNILYSDTQKYRHDYDSAAFSLVDNIFLQELDFLSKHFNVDVSRWMRTRDMICKSLSEK